MCIFESLLFSSVMYLMFVPGKMALRLLGFSLLSRKCCYALPVKVFTSIFAMNNSQEFKTD